MIGEYPLIPTEAFLFFPKQQLTVEDVNGTKQRIIFSGGVQFDDVQKQKVQKLRLKLKSNPKNQHLLDYSEDFLVRSLQAAQFKIDQTVKALKQYYVWENKTIPLIISPKTQQILKKGTLYMCGRDCYFRPIIVVNIKKLLALDLQKEDLIESLSFFFQYMIQNVLVQGQIQQWILIIDLGNVSIFSLGKSMIDIIVHLSSVFKVRAVKNYLINCPSSIKILWSTLKNVLNEDQIRKISMSEKKYLKPQNFEMINRSQIQQKYGGTLPNIQKYWPNQLNPNSVIVQNINTQQHMITQQQYEQRYNSGLLKNKKVQKKFIRKFQNLCTIKASEDSLTERDLNEKFIMQQQQQFYQQEVQPIQIQVSLTPLNFFEMF